MKKLALLSDIPEGGAIIVLANDVEIALFKIQGQIFALNNECPHQGGPLGEGTIEGTCVTCPWHGWQFDIPTGLCSNMPTDPAQTLPITIIDDAVWL